MKFLKFKEKKEEKTHEYHSLGHQANQSLFFGCLCSPKKLPRTGLAVPSSAAGAVPAHAGGRQGFVLGHNGTSEHGSPHELGLSPG